MTEATITPEATMPPPDAKAENPGEEAKQDTDSSKTEARERSRERQRSDVEKVSKLILGREVKKSLAVPMEDRTDKDGAYVVYHQLLTGKNLAGKDIVKVDFAGEGPPMQAFGFETEKGEEVAFGNKEVQLAGISEATADGKAYICSFKNASGETMMLDAAGKVTPINLDDEDLRANAQESGYTVLQVPIPKEDVANAQLVSEADKLVSGLSKDQQKVLGTYIDTLPQNNPEGKDVLPEDIDSSLEQSAKEQGLPTTEMMKSVLQAEVMSDETKAFLDKLDQSGDVLLSKKDFVEGMGLLGVSKDALDKKQQALHAELQSLAAKKNSQEGGDTTIVDKQIAEVQAQMKLVGEAYNDWDNAEKVGKSPVGEAYDKMANGDVPEDASKQLLEAIDSGDEHKIMESMGSVLATLPEAQNLTEEQKKEAKSRMAKAIKIAKVTGKWGGIGLLTVLALAVVGTVAVGAGAVVAASSAGK